MSDLGDLTKYILENTEGKATLADLTWLSLDDQEVSQRVVPIQNLDAIPELEDAWGYLDDDDLFRLSPENRRPSAPHTPFHSERETSELVSPDLVVLHARKLLSNLLSPSEVLENLLQHYDKDSLRHAKTLLNIAFNEYGLEGPVYIDATLFSKCASGEGQDHVRRVNGSALFVVAKKSCGTCRWATDRGMCQRFSKQLVASKEDIVYTQDTLDFYHQKALSAGKTLSKKASNSFKEQVRSANLAPLRSEDHTTYKPVQEDLTKGLTREDAVARLKASKATSHAKVKTSGDKALETMRVRLATSMHDTALVDLVKASPVFEDLEDRLHLEGSLCLDRSAFSEESQVEKILQANPHLIPYNKVGGEYQPFDIHSPASVSQIVYRYALQKGASLEAPVLARMANKLFKADRDYVLKFAQALYSKPVPTKVAKYQSLSPVVFDPTQGLDAKVAKRKLASLSSERVVAPNRNKELRQKAMLIRMACGHKDEALRQTLVGEGLDTLLPHVGLQGYAYFITSGMSPQEVDLLCRKRPQLKNIPHVTLDTLPSLAKQASFHETLWSRYAATQKTTPGRKVQASFGNRLASMSSEDLLTFAQMVYTQTLTKGVQHYEASGQQGFEVSAQDMATFRENLRLQTQPEATRRDLSFYVKRKGGKEVLGMMVNAFGPELVQNLYFPDRVKTSTLSSMRKSDLEARVYDYVVNPNYKAAGLNQSIVMPSFYTSKMGRWLRDVISSGVSQELLSKKLASKFSTKDIVAHAPLIMAMREEIGLMGQTYLDADSYGNCNAGKRALKATVTQIVAGSKCEGCVHNRMGSCLLYGRDLRAEASYDHEEFKRMVSHRVAKGELQKADADHLYSLNETGRALLKKASTYVTSNEVRQAEMKPVAHYGEALSQGSKETQIFELLKEARASILNAVHGQDLIDNLEQTYGKSLVKMARVHIDQLEERLLFDMSKHVSASTLAAPDETFYMEKYALTSNQVAELVQAVKPESTKDSDLSIAFGDFKED